MAVYREHDPENEDFYETMPATAGTVARPLYVVQQLVRLIISVINSLLVIRILLELLGANANNGFVSFIYSITNPLVQPFVNLFNYTLQSGISHLDIAAVVAIVVYSLVAYIIDRLLGVSRI